MANPMISANFGDALDPRFERIWNEEYNMHPDMIPMLYGMDPHNGRDSHPGKPRGQKPRETTGERKTSVESQGSGSGRKGAERNRADGLPSWLPEVNAAFYKEGMETGLYKGPKDPNLLKELDYLKKKLKVA